MRIHKKRAISVTRSILKEAILRGVIDPRGKSDNELAEAAGEYLSSWTENSRIIVALDYRSKLLSHARQFFRSQDYQLSCLMFAIWTEHWVNGILDVRCDLLRIPEDERKDLIRTTQIVAKCTWLFRLLGVRPIPSIHLARIRMMADLRNAFVHYKWVAHDPDDMRANNEEKRRLLKALKDYEKTIKYLQNYETEQLLHKSSRRVSRLFKHARSSPKQANRPRQPTRGAGPTG